MIKLQLDGGELDLYDNTSIVFSFTSFLFAEKTKEPYSTDFQIPKTQNNIALLGLSNTMDYNAGNTTTRLVGTLVTENQNYTVDIQIVGSNKNDITLFLTEHNDISDLLGKHLVKKYDNDYGGIVKDDSSTIFPWYGEGWGDTSHPRFEAYNYGGSLNYHYAQRHASVDLLTIANKIYDNLGIRLFIDQMENYEKLYFVASNKKVCPWNTKQAFHGRTNERKEVYLFGGQHVCNDMSTTEDDNYTRIRFNRDCTVSGHIIVSYYNKQGQSNGTFQIAHASKWGGTYTNLTLEGQYTNYVVQTDVTFDIKKGDAIYFLIPGVIDKVALTVYWEITNYTVVEGDGEDELLYKYKRVYPICLDQKGNESTGQISSSTYNGTNYIYMRHGSPTEYIATAAVPRNTFYSYFGLWWNLPEVNLNEFLYLLCWLQGKKYKPTFDMGKRFVDFEPFSYVQINPADIVQTNYTSSRYGQNNYFRCANDGDELKADFTISNVWLEKDKDVKKAPIARLGTVSNNDNMAVVPQYSEFEYDEDSKTYKCKYEEVDGWCLLQKVGGKLTPILYFVSGMSGFQIRTLNLDTITQTIEYECELVGKPYIMNNEYADVDGRLCLVVDGEVDATANTQKVKMLVINDLKNIKFDANGNIEAN